MTVALDPDDTIAAIASPSGAASRGIVRLSGPEAIRIALDGFVGEHEQAPPRFALARTGSLQVDGLRPPLPAILALWPCPRTYTRQNMAEIHLAGSPSLLGVVLAHCLTRGARLAERGEFTLRAFLSGRIDLTKAEAVLGVIDARSPAQLEAALEQLAGGLSGPILQARERLLDFLAHLEANLDFTDEPDVEPLTRAAQADELRQAADELSSIGRRLTDRDRPDDHPRVVLVGPPNVGKSRLFNALIGRDRAIVSPQAGTTRDYLSATLDCAGLTVELVDTAGIEVPNGSIAAQAQALGTIQAGRAQLLLDCRSAETDGTGRPARAAGAGRLQVWTKGDRELPDRQPSDPDGPIVTSALTGAGLPALRMAIAQALGQHDGEGNLPAGTAARCRESITRARDALESAANALVQEAGDELVSFDLRQAVDELGKIVGAVVTDDILDRIFRRFCIGK